MKVNGNDPTRCWKETNYVQDPHGPERIALEQTIATSNIPIRLDIATKLFAGWMSNPSNKATQKENAVNIPAFLSLADQLIDTHNSTVK